MLITAKDGLLKDILVESYPNRPCVRFLCACAVSPTLTSNTSAQAAIILIRVIKLSCHYFITRFIYFCSHRCLPSYWELFLIDETDVSCVKSKLWDLPKPTSGTHILYICQQAKRFVIYLFLSDAAVEEAKQELAGYMITIYILDSYD